jgi:23S rRNA pseudouridine2605 synthase
VSERLQKFLARAGVASRRHAEVLITAGRVSVNNQRVTELGSKVEPSDLVMVDGQLVTVPEHTSWYLLHKPPGVVTTLSDPEGRPTVAGLLEGVEERVFPVGRLDWDAEGALLLTNDGGVAHRLLHPSFEVPRTYLVKVKGAPTDETLARLREGVRLEDGPARALRAERFEATERNTWLILQVGEGRPHLVKRLCAAVGHPVVRLFRPGQAGVSVAGLQPGQLRPLTTEEVQRVEAIAAGGTVPEPAPFLPPRRHGRAGDDDEALDAGEMPGTADTEEPAGVGRAGTARAGGPRGRSSGFEAQGRDGRNGRGGKPRFGRPGRDAERPGSAGRPWRGAAEGGDRPRGRGASRGGFGARAGTEPREDGKRRGRDSGPGESGARPVRGAGEGRDRPRRPGPSRGGFGARASRGAGVSERFHPGGRDRDRGFGDRPPRETGANEGDLRPRGRGAPRAGFGGRPSRGGTGGDFPPPGRGAPRAGFGSRSSRGPGEGESRPRGRGFERTGFGDRPSGGTDAGESGFRPRGRGPPRGGSGSEGDFRPRGRGAPRAGFGSRSSRGPAEDESRPRGRGAPRAGFGGRPSR